MSPADGRPRGGGRGARSRPPGPAAQWISRILPGNLSGIGRAPQVLVVRFRFLVVRRPTEVVIRWGTNRHPVGADA